MVTKEEHEAHEEHDGHKQKEKDVELGMTVWKLALKNKRNVKVTLLRKRASGGYFLKNLICMK